MYKVVWMGQFNTNASDGGSPSEWERLHGRIASAPDLLSVVRNRALGGRGLGSSEDAPLFKGYSCASLADRAAFERFHRFARGLTETPAGGNGFDLGYREPLRAVVDEEPIIEGKHGPIKAVWFMRFKDAVRASPERTREAHARWQLSHGKNFGIRVPGIERYVQNHVIAGLDEAGEPDPEAELCGFSECWFQDEAALARAINSREWAAMNQDAADLFDASWSIHGRRAIVEEFIVKQ